MRVLSPTRNQVGESPLWSAAEQALYWVDIEAQRLHRYDWTSAEEQAWPMPERLACIALHADGGLLAAMETGIFHLHPQADGACRIDLLQGIRFARAGMRFNDGRCDRAGRFWVSSMVRDMSLAARDGALYCYDQRGLSAPLVSGLITGNGLGLSPDGKTLYLSDSHPEVQQVWAFALASDGSLSQQRTLIDMQQHPGRPDGAAVDADGGYWICGNDAGMVHRFLPDGTYDRSLTVPVSKPSMCAFGGPSMEHLFITSITPAQAVPGYERASDGAVFITKPGVRGLLETPFQP